MKCLNLKSVIRKKRKTYVKTTPQITAENILNRDFSAATQSMSRVGRCIDNGPIEGFWGIIKSEMYYLKKFHNFEELKLAIDKYIKFCNKKRLKGLTPIEYREQTLAA